MEEMREFYNFYRPTIGKICQSIREGKVLIVVGINSIGKTLLSLKLLSGRFRKECLSKHKTHLVYLEFKDKNPPTSGQLYRYWLTQTAKTLKYALPTKETFNDYSFQYYLTDMARNLRREEKLVFVVLDAQNILNQGEGFFKSLIYLHRFTYRQVSYILLSEPHILDTQNIWAQRFVQDFTHYSYHFLKLFTKDAILADIKREEGFLKTKLAAKHHVLILKYSGGLHGVIGALCYFLKNNPHITNFRQLKELVFNDKMFEFWIEDILDSLPRESVKILKEVIRFPLGFHKYHSNIYGKWLVDLGFLRKNGNFRHPMMSPIVQKYSFSNKNKDSNLKLVNNQLCYQSIRIKLTKREQLVFEKLHKLKGRLVTYDAIGEILWKDRPDQFSLWAIAQIIRRLRKKLSLYAINPKIISSQRGEGYILH